MELAIRYMIEFGNYENPPGRKDQFEVALRSFLDESGFDCLMGLIGGSFRAYGCISRIDADITAEDRRSIIDWIASQPVKCTARVGPPEDVEAAIAWSNEIPVEAIAVDNLTDADRSQAASFAERIKAFIDKVQSRRSAE